MDVEEGVRLKRRLSKQVQCNILYFKCGVTEFSEQINNDLLGRVAEVGIRKKDTEQ